MARSKYETHVLPRLDEVTAWVRDGAGEREVAARLEVSESTLHRYLTQGEQGRCGALVRAFAQGDRERNEAVEAALFKRAQGMEYTEETVKVSQNRTTGEPETVTTSTTKYLPPDIRSIIFWLTNRRGDRWRAKPEEAEKDESEEEGGVIVIPEVSGQPQEEP